MSSDVNDSRDESLDHSHDQSQQDDSFVEKNPEEEFVEAEALANYQHYPEQSVWNF